MELIQHWAGISFSAQNGDPEGLLTAAAAGSLPLSDVVPRPGGFSARCAAWHYRKLAVLARKRRVRLRIQKRCGLFFVSALCSGAEGFGQDVLSFSRSCFGSKGLSGSSSRWD